MNIFLKETYLVHVFMDIQSTGIKSKDGLSLSLQMMSKGSPEQLTARIKASLLDEDETEILVVIYEAIFESDEAFTEIVNSEISPLCIAKVFPYIREAIADISRRMPLKSPLRLDVSIAENMQLDYQKKKHALVSAKAQKTSATPQAARAVARDVKA